MAADSSSITLAASTVSLSPVQATRRADRPEYACRAPCAISQNSIFRYFGLLRRDAQFFALKVGAEHLLLGADFSDSSATGSASTKSEALSYSATEKQTVLAGNAKSLLHI